MMKNKKERGYGRPKDGDETGYGLGGGGGAGGVAAQGDERGESVMEMRMKDGVLRVRAEIPAEVKMLLNDLRILQAQIESLPGPRLHQDHDFSGDDENLETLFGWFQETLWVPYWGQPETGTLRMLFLGGRDPWIQTLEMRLWECLSKLAELAGCELCGRGAVSPDDNEWETIYTVLPEVAEANGWVFQEAMEKGLQ